TDRIEARRHVQATQLRRLAEEVPIVRREALRAIEEHLHAGGLERGHAPHGGCEERLDVAEVRGQLLEGEILGDPLPAPGLRLGLEPADEELAGVLLEVRARIGVAQDRQVGREARDRLDRKSTRLNSSHDQISYAVFCLKKKKKQ